MLWPQQEALSWVTAVEEQIKKMLTETVSHKRMVREGGRIIVVGGARRKGKKYEGGEEEKKEEEGKEGESGRVFITDMLFGSSEFVY